MENGILWGRSGYNQETQEASEALLSHWRPTSCLPPGPVTSAPKSSSVCPLLSLSCRPFCPDSAFLRWTDFPCLQSLSLSGYANIISLNTKLAVKPLRSWWFLASALQDSPLYPLCGRHMAPRARPASSALCTLCPALLWLQGSFLSVHLGNSCLSSWSPPLWVFSVFPGRVGPFTCLSSSGHVLLGTLSYMSIIVTPTPSPDCELQRMRTIFIFLTLQLSSVVSDSLRSHEPQHARPPCPSPTPGVYPNPCPLSRWCHPTFSSFAIPFSSCPQSFPAPGSFPMSQFFVLGGQSIGVSASASVLPMNT